MAGGWKHTLLQDPVPGNIVACLEELGVGIRRVNHEEVEGYCPAHFERLGKEDLKSKWAVNTESGRHNCFSCGFKGPFVSLVRYMLDCSPEEAIAWVKARGSIERAKRILSGGYIDELTTRTPEEEITEADLALYELVPDEIAATRDLEPDSCDFYGVLWDPEHEYWITPIRDPDTHKLWGWQEKGKGHFHNHPKDMEKGLTLFGMKQVAGCHTVILVESPLDAPRIHSAGLGPDHGVCTVASFGANVTDRQIDLICEHPDVRTLISGLDNDESGHKTNADLKRRVNRRLRLKFWDYGGCRAKDPGEQTDDEIWDSYDNAYSSMLARW